MAGVFVNPFTDYGFKKIFGEEANKAILIDFLNALLQQEQKIVDLTFKKNEQLGELIDAKGVIFDIYCENEKGEKFIIELQKNKQNWFKERTIYYSTFPIRDQVEKGSVNYKMEAVYCIGILDFVFNDYKSDSERRKWFHEIKLKDQNGEVFYDKLTYVYLEMPNFNKSESELKTQLDKWLYFIKNLADFQKIPEILRHEVVFQQAFETAEIARFSKPQLESYEQSMKGYRDLASSLDTAEQRGINIGVKEQQIKTAIVCIEMGMPVGQISLITGLSEQEILLSIKQ